MPLPNPTPPLQLTPYPNAKFTDGDWTTASAVSLPVFSNPFPTDPNPYVMTQDYVVRLNSFQPLALGTPHSVYPQFLLSKEGDRADLGNGIVKWTRTYARAMPAAGYDLFETFAYKFIGQITAVTFEGATTILNRKPQTWSVNSRVHYDYFVVDPSLSADNLGAVPIVYASAGNIPKIYGMFYVNQAVINGALYGGVQFAMDTLTQAGYVLPTWPTSEQYSAMCADAMTNGWNSTVSKMVLFTDDTLGNSVDRHMPGTIDTTNSVLGGQVPVEDSRLQQWMGNIYLRTTRYVLAQ